MVWLSHVFPDDDFQEQEPFTTQQEVTIRQVVATPRFDPSVLYGFAFPRAV